LTGPCSAPAPGLRARGGCCFIVCRPLPKEIPSMWLFSSRKAQGTAPARRPSAYRPRLEALEDRCVPNAGFLDPTFGTAGAGLVTTAIASINNSGGQGLGQRALIQSDGKVLAIGGSTVRYNADGSLDNSFGSVGIANYSGNGGALQSDGKILLASISGSGGF